jgi:hypothetical protein
MKGVFSVPRRRGFFSYQEAAEKVGKIVEVCVDLADIPAGTLGKVVRIEEGGEGCAVVVAWHYTLPSPRQPLEDAFGYYTYGSHLQEL